MFFLCWVSRLHSYCSDVPWRPLTLMKGSDHRFQIGFLRDPLAQPHFLEECGVLVPRLVEAQSQFKKECPIIDPPAPHNMHRLVGR
jgi:hypothetical protein